MSKSMIPRDALVALTKMGWSADEIREHMAVLVAIASEDPELYGHFASYVLTCNAMRDRALALLAKHDQEVS